MKNGSSAHENSDNTELLAMWVFSNRCILTQQTVGRSTWLYGYGLHLQCHFVDQLYQLDVSPRISSSPVPATRCPFAINNSFSM